MTWVADKLILTNAMTGYSEIQNNIKANESANTKVHKCYTVTLGKPETTSLTNNKNIDVRLVRLEINYLQNKVSDYDTNCDDFEALKDVIKVLSPFVSWVTITPPERLAEKAQNSIAVLEFYFGVRIY